MNSFEKMSEIELLQIHGAVIDELQRRRIVRTRNNPIGDYTEWLVCMRLQLEMQDNSQASYDAIDSAGIRYQIKGRHSEAKSVQFSAIRNLEQKGFDFVIAVIFKDDYSIRLAVKLSHVAVLQHTTYRKHVNAHILILTNKIIGQEGVTDISHELGGIH